MSENYYADEGTPALEIPTSEALIAKPRETLFQINHQLADLLAVRADMLATDPPEDVSAVDGQMFDRWKVWCTHCRMERWAPWVPALCEVCKDHLCEALMEVDDDALWALMFGEDEVVAKAAVALYKHRNLNDAPVAEPPHCEECFEGCPKCEHK